MPRFWAQNCWHVSNAPQPLLKVPLVGMPSIGTLFGPWAAKIREKLTQGQECDQKPIASRVLSSIHSTTNKTLAGTW